MINPKHGNMHALSDSEVQKCGAYIDIALDGYTVLHGSQEAYVSLHRRLWRFIFWLLGLCYFQLC